jgi:predicted PurR-regulated permease PerM
MASRTHGGGSVLDDSTGAHSPDPDRRPSLTPISLFLVLVTFWILTQIEFVLILGLFGLLLGTILEGPVGRLEARHIPRPAAIFLVYVAIIGTLVLLVFLIIPPIADQAGAFREEVPATLRELEQEWAASSNPLLSGPGDDLLDRAINFFAQPQGSVSTDTAQRAIPVLTSITAGVVAVLTLLVITFYYLMEKALIRQVIIQQLSPERQPRVNRIWEDVENKVGGWMRGQLVLCLIIGTIATVSYGIIDLRFWPLLGLWAGLTEIIPIVGPWIGGIPAVLIALTMGWQTALITGGIIVGMQTLENWFLVPRVMRGAVGLTPLTVFLAILAGTQFMGIVGAVLAIPIAATLQVIVTNFLDARRVRSESRNVSGWRWMLTRATARDENGFTTDGNGDSAPTYGRDHPAAKPPVSQAQKETAAISGSSSPGADASDVPAPSHPAWNPRSATSPAPASPPGWGALRRSRPDVPPADGTKQVDDSTT